MKQFTKLLKSISDKLNLPQPVKSQILLEIAHDLEDLYRFYREKGLSEAEAVEKSRVRLNLSDATINELIDIHQTPLRRFLSRFSEQAQSFWERMVLMVLLLIIGGIGLYKIITTPFMTNASTFIYPLIFIFFSILTLTLMKIYQLFLKEDHDLRKVRSGIPGIIFLGAISILTGFIGHFFELYRTGPYGLMCETKLAYLIFTTEHNHDFVVRLLPEFMVKTSAMVMLSLLVAIFAGLSWFILINKVTRIEIAETEFISEIQAKDSQIKIKE